MQKREASPTFKKYERIYYQQVFEHAQIMQQQPFPSFLEGKLCLHGQTGQQLVESSENCCFDAMGNKIHKELIPFFHFVTR